MACFNASLTLLCPTCFVEHSSVSETRFNAVGSVEHKDLNQSLLGNTETTTSHSEIKPERMSKTVMQ